MANIPFDSTLGGQYANTYVSLGYATDFFSNHYNALYNTTWSALSAIQQQRLLIQACRVIETARFTNYVRPTDYSFFYDYITGTIRQLAERMEPIRYLNTQNLQFPRNLDLDLGTGAVFIPDSIMEAQCEQAYYLLSYDGQAVANRLQGIVNDSAALGRGQIHVSQQYISEGSAFAPMALELCRPFFLRGGQRMRRA